jgi:hypothetical protein
MSGPTPGPGAPGQGEPLALGRRIMLGAAGTLVLGGIAGAAWLMWPDGPPPPQRYGPRRLVPPLLRARVGQDDLVFLLTRRSEQDATDPDGAPAPRERIDLLALDAATLAQRFEAYLASVDRGALRDAGLMAEQGATIWTWLGGIGALSAVDGRVLADQPGLAELNPGLPIADATSRSAWRVTDSLLLQQAPNWPAWRFDPRDFHASAVQGQPGRPLPVVNPAAAVGQGGPTAFRVNEARLGEAWLGLPAETEKPIPPLAPRGQDGRFLSPAGPPPGTGQALWRGAVRMASAAPPNWPANMPDRFGQAERLVDLAPVTGMAGLQFAGFLTAGTAAPIVLSDPQSLLLLHGAAGQNLGLMRVAPDGRVPWRAALPVAAVRSVLPGPRHLVLMTGSGAPEIADAVLVSVALADGVVTERRLSA